MIVAELYANLEADLAFVEDQLRVQLRSREQVLEDAAVHLLNAGGKRLRPVFVLLAGTFGQYDRNRLAHVAVGLELIHMATLVHDDVIDNADTRRGMPTVKARFGNRVAMYTGDFIFARALSTLSNIDDVRIHKTLATAIERMCLGEIEQIRDLFSLEQTMRTYLMRIRRKTALLIEMSCALGALAAGAPEHIVSAVRRYGYYTGMAFQITDDVLDFTSTEERLGKPVGSDLRQGNLTAPVLLALRDEETSRNLRELIAGHGRFGDMRQAVELVKNSGGVKGAMDLADRYLIKAHEGLACLPPTPTRASLAALATFVGKRDH